MFQSYAKLPEANIRAYKSHFYIAWDNCYHRKRLKYGESAERRPAAGHVAFQQRNRAWNDPQE